MNIEIEKAFNGKKLSEKDKIKYEKIYIDLEKNFKYKFFNFNYPEEHIELKWEYYSILKLYLENNGYGYIAKEIGLYIDKKEINDIELAKLLMDCNLINKYNKDMKSNIENKHIFEYEKKSGLRKNINIEYKNSILFEIKNISYSNVDYISHNFNSNKKEINIEINIDNNKQVNFTEILTIYTTYGVDKLEFKVKCNETIDPNIGLKNIEQYLDLCKTNNSKANEIFKKYEFKKWLEDGNYTTQIMNYNESKSINEANGIASAFNIFCALNNIYNEEIVNTDEEMSNSNLEISLYDKLNEAKDNENVLDIDNDEEIVIYEETINTEYNDINPIKNELKKESPVNKSLFSGIKKKLGSIFKRK